MKNVYIITGGSSGIGLEAAKEFKDGIVLITGRNEDKLIQAEKQLKQAGIDVVYKSSDISDKDSVLALFEYGKSLGKIRAVINSAGVSGVGVDARLTFEIDLIGSQNLIDVTMEYMEENTVLILVASMMGHVVPSNDKYNDFLLNPTREGSIDALLQVVGNNPDIAYNFSKKGVHMLVEKYASEFGKKGARIISLSPGIIMTPMGEKAAEAHPERMNYMKSMTPAGRNGRPEDISYVLSFLVDERASFITGTDITVDGGLTVNMPAIIAAAQKEK